MNLCLARLALIFFVLLSLLVVPAIGFSAVYAGEWAAVALMGTVVTATLGANTWYAYELDRRRHG
jgi:hypothetical protein